MITQSRPDQHLPTPQWKATLQQRTYQLLLGKTASDWQSAPALPTTGERQFVILGFILGVLSIFCGFFPLCGLPIAVSGLIMGLAGRHIRALHRVVAWTVTLSLIGLFLALVNIAISIGIYFSYYLWQ